MEILSPLRGWLRGRRRSSASRGSRPWLRPVAPSGACRIASIDAVVVGYPTAKRSRSPVGGSYQHWYDTPKGEGMPR